MYATLTIPALKSLISDMNVRSQNGDIIVPSKARKADIVTLITDEIDRLWDEAKEWDRITDEIDSIPVKLPETDRFFVRTVPSLAARAEILAGKVNAYMRQNGTDKLTPAQWRRVRKAMAKHAVTHIDMGQFYVYP